MSIEVVIIFSILGIVCYGLVLKNMTWEKKHEPIFWISVFAPLFLVNMFEFDNDRIKNAVYSFFGAVIVMEVLRHKIMQKINNTKEKYKNRKIKTEKLYVEPKKRKKKTRKSDKKKV